MVIDLKIEPGVVRAQVQGRSLYRISIKIDPVPVSRWEAIRKECSGRIDSLIALLNGKLSHPVMEVVTRNGTGLFPSPKEINMDCSCPDWAGLCKHLAAVLYGIGARLDQKPELLFLLRKVDHADLITNPFMPEAVATKGEELAASELSSIFGIDIPDVPNPPSAAAPDRLLEASPAPKEAKPRVRTPRKRERAAPSSIPSKQEQPSFGTITYHELAAEGVSPQMIEIWLSMGVIRPPVEFGRYERTASTAIHLEAHRQALKARAARESAPGEGPRRTAIPRQKGSKPGEGKAASASRRR
jgi:uncharacterized Zn finger protein